MDKISNVLNKEKELEMNTMNLFLSSDVTTELNRLI